MTPQEGTLRSPGLADRLRFCAVAAYLLVVGTGLWLTGRIHVDISPKRALQLAWRSLTGWQAVAKEGCLTRLSPEEGFCYLARIPGGLVSYAELRSRVQLFEDGAALGPAHSAHAEIRRIGRGRFSHWSDRVYFSASDNSDPRANGRRYTFKAE